MSRCGQGKSVRKRPTATTLSRACRQSALARGGVPVGVGQINSLEDGNSTLRPLRHVTEEKDSDPRFFFFFSKFYWKDRTVHSGV
jgi:hypothetical protein